MKRWNNQKSQYVEDASANSFVEALIQVCREHNMSIAHEDQHGSFIITNLEKSWLNALQAAHIGK